MNKVLIFQIKSLIVKTLSKIDIGDLRKLIQLSSVISLTMNDPAEITADTMVSLSS